MKERRRFNTNERIALWLASGGKCEACGVDLESGWHADHIHPYSKGGPTDITNGAALCPTCNHKKGDTIMTEDFLSNARGWQREAVDVVRNRVLNGQRSVTLEHCPGSGKTYTSAFIDLEVRRMLDIERTVYFAPRLALIAGTCATYERVGTRLNDPNGNKPPLILPGTVGFAQSYQSLSVAGADLARMALQDRKFHLVIDEAQFAGESKKGAKGLLELAESAAFITVMSATLERSDRSPIAGVRYDPQGLPAIDHSVEYRQAVADGYVRDVDLRLCELTLTWDDGEHEELSVVEEHLRDALVSRKVWEPMADRFVEILRRRQAVEPREKGVVFACNQDHARDIHQYMRDHGLQAKIAVSQDEARAAAVLRAFPDDPADVLVSVQMVGVGFNAPRIGTCLYLSHWRHEPAVYQAVARACRVDPESRIPATDQVMCIVAPSDRRMTKFLSWLEDQAKQGIIERPPPPPRDDDDDIFCGPDRQDTNRRIVADADGFAESVHAFNGYLSAAENATLDVVLKRHGIGHISPVRFTQAMQEAQSPSASAAPAVATKPPKTEREKRADVNTEISSIGFAYIRRIHPEMNKDEQQRLYRAWRNGLGKPSDQLTFEQLQELRDRARNVYGF